MSIDKLFEKYYNTVSEDDYDNLSPQELCHNAFKAGYESGQESKQLEIDNLLHQYCDYDLIKKENKEMKALKDINYNLFVYLEKLFEAVGIETPRLFETKNEYIPKLEKLVKEIKRIKIEIEDKIKCGHCCHGYEEEPFVFKCGLLNKAVNLSEYNKSCPKKENN